MRTPLNTEYQTLTVYFNIHASMPLQFKLYRPVLVIKSLITAILPYPKIRRSETHGIIYNSAPQPPSENLQLTWLKSCF